VIVCDTGPLVAAATTDDAHHRHCVDPFAALHLAGRPILVPGPVAAEVEHPLARERGAQVMLVLDVLARLPWQTRTPARGWLTAVAVCLISVGAARQLGLT
jgi:hypothetical protein